jgi:hypothetical protein
MNAVATFLPRFPLSSQIYGLKGTQVKDPSAELAVRKLNALLQDSQGHADDLSPLNSQVSGQLFQQLPILFGEADRGLTRSSFQADSSENMAAGCTNAIQQTPENTLSGTERDCPQLYAVVGTDSTPRTSDPIALEWLLNPDKADAVFDRILAQLVLSEAREPDVHLRDDYRIAWLTVRFCQTGECNFKQHDGSIKSYSPYVYATFKVLGCHPDQVFSRMQQRRQALLGQPIRIGAVRSAQTVCREPAGAAALPPKNPQTAPVPNSERKKA